MDWRLQLEELIAMSLKKRFLNGECYLIIN